MIAWIGCSWWDIFLQELKHMIVSWFDKMCAIVARMALNYRLGGMVSMKRGIIASETPECLKYASTRLATC